ncbi:MAG: flagellar hook-length control protein FliK, partial [Pseudobdellovibrionaceae bacterium]
MLNINSSNTKADMFSQKVIAGSENKEVLNSSKLLSGSEGKQDVSFKQKLKEQDQVSSSSREKISDQSQEPTKEPKEKAAPDKPPEEAGKKARGSPSAERQRVFQEFMDSIESELGIDPARFAVAMAKVGIQAQDSLPEEVAGAVIENLDLPTDKEDQAKQMYLGFLGTLNQLEKPPVIQNLVVSDPTSSAPSEILRRFSSTQNQKQNLESAVGQLNQNFWMKKAEVGQSTIDQAVVNPEMIANPMGSSSPEVTQQLPQGFSEQQKILNEVAARQRLADWTENANVAQFAHMKPGAMPTSLEQQVAMLAAQQNEANQGLPMNLQAGVAPRVLMNEETYSSPAGNFLMQGEAFGAIQGKEGAMNLSSGEAGEDSLGDSLKDSASDLQGRSDLTGSELPMNADFGLSQNKPEQFFPPTAMMAAGQVATPTEKNESIQAILNQAKFLAQKGGGEMNVQMTPEGLGKVHLKIMMTDGKLQVQMSADSAEAKSLIESSFADLKQSLHSKKLTVDSMKVDYVQILNTDNNNQQ